MAAPLDVLGDLVISTPAGDSKLTGRGERLVLELPSLRAARTLLRNPLTAGRSARVRSLSRLQAGLSHSRLEAAVEIRGRRVAEMGHEVEPGLLSALLGLGGLRLRLRALVGALLSR